MLSAVPPCGEQNCEAHIEILTLVVSGPTIAEVFPESVLGGSLRITSAEGKTATLFGGTEPPTLGLHRKVSVDPD